MWWDWITALLIISYISSFTVALAGFWHARYHRGH